MSSRRKAGNKSLYIAVETGHGAFTIAEQDEAVLTSLSPEIIGTSHEPIQGQEVPRHQYSFGDVKLPVLQFRHGGEDLETGVGQSQSAAGSGVPPPCSHGRISINCLI